MYAYNSVIPLMSGCKNCIFLVEPLILLWSVCVDEVLDFLLSRLDLAFSPEDNAEYIRSSINGSTVT
mgnify:CR=1 FL=1